MKTLLAAAAVLALASPARALDDFETMVANFATLDWDVKVKIVSDKGFKHPDCQREENYALKCADVIEQHYSDDARFLAIRIEGAGGPNDVHQWCVGVGANVNFMVCTNEATHAKTEYRQVDNLWKRVKWCGKLDCP